MQVKKKMNKIIMIIIIIIIIIIITVLSYDLVCTDSTLLSSFVFQSYITLVFPCITSLKTLGKEFLELKLDLRVLPVFNTESRAKSAHVSLL